FIHERLGTDAIVERYVEGRELYVGLLGNERLVVLPVWELRFDRMPKDAHLIATRKAKWDRAYQEEQRIDSSPAELEQSIVERITHVAKRIYRALALSGYARLDFRLTPTGRLYFLEANPNPQIAEDEDFAESARAAGVSYDRLIARILSLGLKSAP